MSIRIGAVSYLNTKPLIYGLRDRLPDAQLLLDLPSRLADRLNRGDLDVALIPSVEFLRGSGLSILSDACIACRGPVRSVRVLFNCPPAEVRSLALDEGSRTSAAVSQVLMWKRFGVRPSLQPLPITAKFHDVRSDAVLVIGDRAMQIDTDRYHSVWDVGQEWNTSTNLSFVFALWIVSEAGLARLAPHGLTLESLTSIFHKCRDDGLASLDNIIANEAPKHGLTHTDCLRYFREQLHFNLGPRELGGLNLFRDEAARLELVPASSHELSLQPL